MAKSISKSYGSSLKVYLEPYLSYHFPCLFPSSCLHHLLPAWLKQSPKHSSCFSLPAPHLCLQSIPNTATRCFLLSQSRSFFCSKPIFQKSKSQIPYNTQIDPYELTSPLFSVPAIMASLLFFKNVRYFALLWITLAVPSACHPLPQYG